MASLTNGNKNGLSEDISIGDDGIELNGKAALVPNLSEEELEKQKRQQEYKEELSKIQEDIATLRLVLNDKLKRENELKALLGVTFVEEIKQDFAEGFNSIKSSTAFQKAAQTITGLGSTVSQNDAYQKTTAGLKSATQKITPAFSTLGGTMKSSLGSFRNSSMFKSFEAGIGSTLSTGRMKNSRSEFNVEGSPEHGGMTTSHSVLGTTTTTNGVAKHDAIPEDKEKN